MVDSCTWTPFRRAEKHFKNRSIQGRLPSLRSYPVLDPSRPDLQKEDPVWQAGWWAPADQGVLNTRRRKIWFGKGKERDLGERPQDLAATSCRRIELKGGKVGYVVADGCIIIPGYLDEATQLDLVQRSLAEYTRQPNPLSLSKHYALPCDLYAESLRESQPLIHPLQSKCIASGSKPVDSSAAVDIEVQREEKDGREQLKSKTAKELMRDIRWANLGLVYQWSTKTYDLSPTGAIAFPPEAGRICREIIKEVDWLEVFKAGMGSDFEPGTWADDYEPDTGIVNFYQLKDTLMGHVDKSELDPYRPLVSLSLGHAAIFLLGTETRQTVPIPIILRSGDVFIMSGLGRKRYHGIPRIMEGTLPQHFMPQEGDPDELAAAKRWISTARININARQVFPAGYDRGRGGHA